MIAALAFLGTITVFLRRVYVWYKAPKQSGKSEEGKKKETDNTSTCMGHFSLESPWVDAENSCCLEVSLIEQFQQQLDTEAWNQKPWPEGCRSCRDGNW